MSRVQLALNVDNLGESVEFYSALFGWQIMKEDEDPAHNYWHIQNGEEFIGGIPPASHRQPGVPAHWLAYFTVSDCDAVAAQAKNLGAKLYLPPTDFEDVGRISIMADPQGATIERALPHLGFDGVSDVRVGKCIRMVMGIPQYGGAGRISAAFWASLIYGSCSSGAVNITVIGSTWATVTIPVCVAALTMLPTSTWRRPTTPVIGDLTWV